MSKVTGKTEGVAQDILDYLSEVAKFYNSEIKIHSGKRSDSYSAEVVMQNWAGNLRRGEIYVSDTLPSDKRAQLDGYYKTVKENARAKDAEKREAKESFLKLAAATIGKASLHFRGRAVDILKSDLTDARIRAALRSAPMKEIAEPGCYHYESRTLIPQVTDATRKLWKKD